MAGDEVWRSSCDFTMTPVTLLTFGLSLPTSGPKHQPCQTIFRSQEKAVCSCLCTSCSLFDSIHVRITTLFLPGQKLKLRINHGVRLWRGLCQPQPVNPGQSQQPPPLTFISSWFLSHWNKNVFTMTRLNSDLLSPTVYDTIFKCLLNSSWQSKSNITTLQGIWKRRTEGRCIFYYNIGQLTYYYQREQDSCNLFTDVLNAVCVYGGGGINVYIHVCAVVCACAYMWRPQEIVGYPPLSLSSPVPLRQAFSQNMEFAAFYAGWTRPNLSSVQH